MGGPHTRWVVKPLVVPIPRATLRLVRGLATLGVVPVGLLEAHVSSVCGEAVLRHLVRVQRVMVRLPEKRRPAVKLLAGEKFLPGRMCLPDGKLLPAMTCHPRPTMHHAVLCHMS